MSPQTEASFNEYLGTLARNRGLWVLTLRELLANAYQAGTERKES